ncbi:MAG: DinB family protein [Blastocatellia bacterium]|nr:DinB family protein [Blastocatellia bacterium]
MSSPLDSYISNWKRIHKQTAAIMAVAPSDQYDWKPSETAMSLGDLMHHIYGAEWGLIEATLTGVFPKEMPPKPTDTAEFIKAFDASHESLIPKISGLTAEQLAEEVAPFGPDKKMSRMTLLHLTHEHEIHHRGQLYVYLRTLGCEVPPLFG